MNALVCRFCGSERKNPRSLRNHERLCKSNPKRRLSIIDYTKRKTSNQYIKAVERGLPPPVSPCKGVTGKKGCVHTDEFKLNQRAVALARGLGGVTQSRWIRYNGKVLGSTYELRVAQSLDEHGVKWDTCTKFKYMDPHGKLRTYTPDIYLIDFDVYLDPKNDFLIQNVNPALGFKDVDKIKLVEEQNNIRVIVVDKHNLNWDCVKALIDQPNTAV